MPLNGRACSRGAAGKSGCSAFLITLRGNGWWPRCSHRISRQFCPGRVHTTLSRPHAAGRHLRERISQTLVEPQRPAQPTRQSGYRLSGHLHRRTCDWPASLSQAELAANRADYLGDVLAHPLNDSFYRERTPDLSKIEYPALVIANWGGLGLHLRGTIRGYMGIVSREKWLKVQSGSYFHTFLQPQNVAMQKRFFDRYLKGIDNGWENEPPVEVEIRAPGDTVKRVVRSTAWPLPETQWTRFFLDAANKTLGPDQPHNMASATYPALSEGVTFSTAPWE